jgi:hypothetical protein
MFRDQFQHTIVPLQPVGPKARSPILKLPPTQA